MQISYRSESATNDRRVYCIWLSWVLSNLCDILKLEKKEKKLRRAMKELLANIIIYGFGTFVLIGSIVNYISERKEEKESKKDDNA